MTPSFISLLFPLPLSLEPKIWASMISARFYLAPPLNSSFGWSRWQLTCVIESLGLFSTAVGEIRPEVCSFFLGRVAWIRPESGWGYSCFWVCSDGASRGQQIPSRSQSWERVLWRDFSGYVAALASIVSFQLLSTLREFFVTGMIKFWFCWVSPRSLGFRH